MQDVATWGSTLETEKSIQAIDSRDNKTYWVTKLADGNIWMTQNLDLDLSAATTLTNSDTDLGVDNNISSFAPKNNTKTSTTGSWSNSYSAAESYDPGDVYLVTSDSTSNDTSYSSLSACTTAGNSEEVCQHGHQGNFYNWYAATAGSNARSMNDGDEAANSICPKGWRLPYGTTDDKSWYNLVSKTSITASNITASPFYIPRAGFYYGSVDSVGSGGVYWSSTAYGEDDGDYYAYQLYFYSSYVFPQDYDDADYGASVRCVAR